MRFVPDELRAFEALERSHLASLGHDTSVCVRLEGIDAPALHYEGAQQPAAKPALDAMLRGIRWPSEPLVATPPSTGTTASLRSGSSPVHATIAETAAPERRSNPNQARFIPSALPRRRRRSHTERAVRVHRATRRAWRPSGNRNSARSSPSAPQDSRTNKPATRPATHVDREGECLDGPLSPQCPLRLRRRRRTTSVVNQAMSPRSLGRPAARLVRSISVSDR